MRTVRRLRLRFLLGFSRYSQRNRGSVIAYRAVHSVTLCPVETLAGPAKVFLISSSPCRRPSLSVSVKNTFGGPGGYCPRVQNTFLFASYSNNSQYIFI